MKNLKYNEKLLAELRDEEGFGNIIKKANEKAKTLIDSKLDVLLGVISKVSGISKKDIKSKSRKTEILLPRQVFMYLSQVRYGVSSEITGSFVNKDHCTCLHTKKLVRNLSDSPHDPLIYLLNKVEFYLDAASPFKTNIELEGDVKFIPSEDPTKTAADNLFAHIQHAEERAAYWIRKREALTEQKNKTLYGDVC